MTKPSLQSTPKPDNRKEFLDVYAEYSRILRTWLVAYGIGGPVIFLTQAEVWKTLSKSGSAALIGRLFLAGVALQVFLALLNKIVMWCLYKGEAIPGFKNSRTYHIMDRVSEWFWIDIGFDLGTIILFGMATFKVFTILTTPSP